MNIILYLYNAQLSRVHQLTGKNLAVNADKSPNCGMPQYFRAIWQKKNHLIHSKSKYQTTKLSKEEREGERESGCKSATDELQTSISSLVGEQQQQHQHFFYRHSNEIAKLQTILLSWTNPLECATTLANRRWTHTYVTMNV